MHFRHDVPNVVWSRDAVMDEDAPNHQNSLFSLHLAADVAAKRPTACFDVARCQGARSVELRAGELAIVLDGIDLSKLKRVPRYTRISNENQKAILL